MRHVILSIKVFLLAVVTVQAHDFWMEPSSFQPKAGELVEVALRVGEHFKGEPVGRTPERIARFFVVGGGETNDVLGTEGRDPAGMFRVKQEGAYVIGYRSRPSFIELSASDFEAYLKEEGLDDIIELRRQRGESDRPARETYSRAAKSLVSAGPPAASGFDQSLDFPLELIPAANPYALKPGEQLSVRLLFRGKPLAGASVAAMSKDKPDQRQNVRTDNEGRATFRLDRAGVWMIKTVHMFPVQAEYTDEGSKRADWESLWASLTFEIRDHTKPK